MQSKLLVLFLALFTYATTNAQSYLNLATFNYQYSPNNSYKNQDGEIDVAEWNASVTLPLQRENGDAFLVGATWNQLSLSQTYPTSPTATISEDVRFTYVLAKLGYLKKWNDNWSATFMLLPKISSDWKDISGEDFQMGGLAIFTKKRDERLKWKFGLYYNHEYFAPFFVPLFGTDWKINDKWRLYGVMPSSLTLEKKVSNKFRFGAGISSPVVSYRLGEQNNVFASGYVHQTYFTKALAFTDFYLTDNLVFSPKIGHSVFRNFRAFAKNDQANFNLWGIAFGDRSEDRPVPYEEFSDGFLFEVGLSYRYDLEKE